MTFEYYYGNATILASVLCYVVVFSYVKMKVTVLTMSFCYSSDEGYYCIKLKMPL